MGKGLRPVDPAITAGREVPKAPADSAGEMPSNGQRSSRQSDGQAPAALHPFQPSRLLEDRAVAPHVSRISLAGSLGHG